MHTFDELFEAVLDLDGYTRVVQMFELEHSLMTGAGDLQVDTMLFRQDAEDRGATRAVKVGFIYDEVADNIAGFGRVLGRALEAQLFIAICNTVLTAACIWVMGLPNLLVLSTIVFFCSFIPVAGVFISSTPICIVAMSHYGFGTMLVAIAMILIVHFIEAYFLNPKIYGTRLRMNPVLTLIILTICGKLFGPWGLILGIPVLNYFFSHAIRYRQPTKIAASEEPRPAESA